MPIIASVDENELFRIDLMENFAAKFLREIPL